MNKNERLYHTTLALAGIFQAATLVKQIAYTGEYDKEAFKASILSIYNTDPPNVVSVYGSVQALKLGLNQLSRLLVSTNNDRDTDIQRYLMGLIYLERKLAHKKEMLSFISNRINVVKQQATFFEITHPNLLASLADIYTNSISTFKLRIHVAGKREYISQPAILDKIRALLLAGIRSAVLWQQVGGSRWQLLLERKKIVYTAQQILTELT